MGATVTPAPLDYNVAGSPANLRVIPALGSAPAAVSASNTNWVFGAWVQQLAATVNDALLYALTASWVSGGAATGGEAFDVEVGLGAAAAEVACASFIRMGGMQTASSGYGGPGGWGRLAFPVLIPAGSRVSTRARKFPGSTLSIYPRLYLVDLADLR